MITSYAPGRVEWLGNHTDYNQGLVLAIALDMGTKISGKRTNSNKIILESDRFNETYETTVDKIVPLDGKHWANYPLGVISELQKRGLQIDGFECEIDGRLPIGAGLASSAAFEVSMATFLAGLFKFDIDKLELAKACQAAEHNFVGVRCGLLDQIASIFSQSGCATFIDFKSLEVKNIPLSDKYIFVITNSLKKHALVRGEYNERRASCESAAKKLGVESLRVVDREIINQNKDKLTEIEFKRAMHVAGENERVSKAIELIANHDFKTIGELMFESHRSSMEYFENSCDELNFLVEAASRIEGCLGARLSGGGFGGATINLVKKETENTFKDRISGEYEAKFNVKPQIFSFSPSGGAYCKIT